MYYLYFFFAQTEQEGPPAPEALVTHRLGPHHAAGEQRAERHLSEGESAGESGSEFHFTDISAVTLVLQEAIHESTKCRLQFNKTFIHLITFFFSRF